MGKEEWCGQGSLFVSFDRDVVRCLNGISDCKVPELRGEKIFCEIVACYVADVAPIDFTETILALSTARSARHLGVRFKKIIDMFANDTKVAISDDFVRVVT